MEKETFEDKWRDAFKHAGVTPSDTVWTNVELGLATAEHEGLKKRLFYYKLMAAASVVFALFAGVVGYNQFKDSQWYRTALEQQKLEIERMIAENIGTQNSVSKSMATEAPTIDSQAPGVEEGASFQSAVRKRNTKSTLRASDVKSQSTEIKNTTASVLPAEDETLIEQGSSKIDLPSLVVIPKPALRLPEEKRKTVDPVQEMLARLADREKALAAASTKEEKNNSQEKLWTSIGVAGGSFSSSGTSISPTASNQAIQFNNNIADDEASASGYTYAVGMNMGTRIANRWVIQGGLNYLTQTSDYTAQAAVGSNNLTSFRPASISELQRFDTKSAVSEEKKLIATAPYNVNNSLRYLTIPVQAGYMVIDSKLGVQLNAGVSTDLFLSNIKTAEGGSLDNTEEEIGDESPYRTTNFSGLVGTELSYRFNDRYRLALNPGIRYPFNSVYKKEVGVDSAPVSFDLGLRFRYIFK